MAPNGNQNMILLGESWKKMNLQRYMSAWKDGIIKL